MKEGSLPLGHLSHHAHGRTRLRIPSKKGDAQYFDRLGGILKAWEAIESFELNPVLGTLLLLHEVDVPELFRFFKSHHLLELQPKTTGPEIPIAKRLATSLGQLNAGIKESSGGSVDLASIAAVGLIGLGTLQLARGEALSPATTLFQMAVQAIQSTKK